MEKTGGKEPSDCGFCYVATTEGYLAEALKSLDSLRRVMPAVSVAIICPSALFKPHWPVNHWIPIEDFRKGPIVKTNALLAPFEKVAFVDTDTYFARDMLDVFRVLEAFDIALAHEPTRGWDYQTDAPPAFCELNTGLIVFRNNARVRGFFERWLREYDQIWKEQQLRNDQPAMRAALWKSPDIRLATLPSEYHCICGKPVSIAWEARLLHDRGNLAKVEREINRQVGYRAYIPGLGQARGFCGKWEWIRNYFRISCGFLRVLLFGRHELKTADTPVRWWVKDAK